MMQPFPDAERALRAAVAATPVLVLNESGKREKQSGKFLARSITRSICPSVRSSVRPSVSTRFVALSDLDLGCGEKEEEKGASVRPSKASKSSRSFREVR